MTSSGYSADFSAASLWEVERFFDEQASDGQASPGGLLSEDLGARLFALGSYVGEVLRRQLGGDWRGNDTDPEAEINVALDLADGTTVWPVQRAMKRYANGNEENIAVYAAALGLDVGQRPPQPTKRAAGSVARADAPAPIHDSADISRFRGRYKGEVGRRHLGDDWSF